VANAAIGTGGMFHKQPAAQFGEMLEINLHGSVRLARAATAVMRPAGCGRIILVASAGGLHGDVGLSAYAASKGGLLAFGRSLAAEGAGKGVLTNMLLPYALTQMTDDGMPSAARARMDPDLVAPVLTALASPQCRLNGEYLVTGGGRLRRVSVVEWGTVLALAWSRAGRLAGVHDEHAGLAHRQAAAREAHGAFQGGGVRRVRSAHQRLHPLAAALRGGTGAAVTLLNRIWVRFMPS
jgi:short chain dehydrogenase